MVKSQITILYNYVNKINLDSLDIYVKLENLQKRLGKIVTLFEIFEEC